MELWNDDIYFLWKSGIKNRYIRIVQRSCDGAVFNQDRIYEKDICAHSKKH